MFISLLHKMRRICNRFSHVKIHSARVLSSHSFLNTVIPIVPFYTVQHPKKSNSATGRRIRPLPAIIFLTLVTK